MKINSDSEFKRLKMQIGEPVRKAQQGSNASIYHSIPKDLIKLFKISKGNMMYSGIHNGYYIISDMEHIIRRITDEHPYTGSLYADKRNTVLYKHVVSDMNNKLRIKKGDKLRFILEIDHESMEMYIKVRNDTMEGKNEKR